MKGNLLKQRAKHVGNFTMIHNEILFLKDKNGNPLDPYLLTLFWRLMSLPPTWDLNIKGLASISGFSYNKTARCLKQLQELGYLQMKPVNENDNFSGYVYTLKETLNPELWNIDGQKELVNLEDEQKGNMYEEFLEKQKEENSDTKTFTELILCDSTSCDSTSCDSTGCRQYKIINNKENNNKEKNNKYQNNYNKPIQTKVCTREDQKNSLSKENNNMEKTCSMEKNSSSLNSFNNSNMTMKNSYSTGPKELNCQKFTNRKMPRKKNSYNFENNSQQNLMQKFLTSTNGDNEDNSKKGTKNKVQQKEQQKGDTISTVDTQEFLRVMGELSVEDNQVAQYLAAAKQIAAENKRINQTNVKKMTNVKRLQTYAASCGAQADIIELLNKYIKVYIEKYGYLAKETFDELYKGLELKTGGNNSAMKELITMAIKYAWKDFYIPDGYKLPVKINSTKDCSNTEQEDKSDDLIPEDELDEDMYELATDEDGNYIEFR